MEMIENRSLTSQERYEKKIPMEIAPKPVHRVLCPVVEVRYEIPSFLHPDFPPDQWPSHIHLSGNTPSELMALAVASMINYPWIKDRSDDRKWRLSVDIIAPGGLAAVEGDLIIVPGCCCGLESWREWYYGSPWLGHNPDVGVQREGDVIHIFPDIWYEEKHTVPISLTREQLEQALREVEKDLTDFLVPLKEYCDMIDPSRSEKFCNDFRERFILPNPEAY